MSHKFQHSSSILFVSAMLAMTLACASRGTAPTQPPSPVEPGPVIATIDGEAIHLSAVDQWLKDDWMSGIAENPTQLYQLRRAGIEGVISFLKRVFGLDRCTWRGSNGFKAYAWASVVACNLLIIARNMPD